MELALTLAGKSKPSSGSIRLAGHLLIAELAKGGTGIIVVSDDLPELLSISHLGLGIKLKIG